MFTLNSQARKSYCCVKMCSCKLLATAEEQGVLVNVHVSFQVWQVTREAHKHILGCCGSFMPVALVDKALRPKQRILG